MNPFHSWIRMPEFTWRRQRSIDANLRSVSLASAVITRSALPNVNCTLSAVPLMSCEMIVSEPGSPRPRTRGRYTCVGAAHPIAACTAPLALSESVQRRSESQISGTAASRTRMWISGMICWTCDSSAALRPEDGNRRHVLLTLKVGPLDGTSMKLKPVSQALARYWIESGAYSHVTVVAVVVSDVARGLATWTGFGTLYVNDCHAPCNPSQNETSELRSRLERCWRLNENLRGPRPTAKRCSAFASNSPKRCTTTGRSWVKP